MASVTRYVRVRAEVEAIHYTDSGMDIVRWVRGHYGTAHFNAAVPAWTSESGIEGFGPQAEHIILDTVVGMKRVALGDWVIMGERGEFYTYEDGAFQRDFHDMNMDITVLNLANLETPLRRV